MPVPEAMAQMVNVVPAVMPVIVAAVLDRVAEMAPDGAAVAQVAVVVA